MLTGMSLLAGGIALAPTTAVADVCGTVAGNLVTNCGFEGGYSASGSDYEVPTGWTASGGYTAGLFYEGPTTGIANSGSYSLQLANDDGDPAPELSQTIGDTSGQTYKETFYLAYGGAGTTDPLPFFDAQIDGSNKLTFNYLTPGTFNAYSFTFVGTGSDTLSFLGNTTPSYWYLDDVSVVAVPEPSAAWMLLLGLGGLGTLARKRLRLGLR